MTLQEIESFVLGNIGYDFYSSLSADLDPQKMADFANLHTCVNLAREEIKLNTIIPSILKWITATATTASTKAYSLPADFDIPLHMFYTEDSKEFELKQVYPSNLLTEVGDLSAEGTPGTYLILGQSSTRVQIEFYNIPSKAGSYRAIYKPVLTTLSTSTDEDILMKKYPKAVIDLATAFAFQLIKKDSAQHDKFYQIGLAECSKIDLREKAADSSYKELPPVSIRNNRAGRTSK